MTLRASYSQEPLRGYCPKFSTPNPQNPECGGLPCGDFPPLAAPFGPSSLVSFRPLTQESAVLRC
jgi:hypothetical protein